MARSLPPRFAVGLPSRTLPGALPEPAAIVIALHALVWAWVGIVSRTNLDLSGDMVEAFVWGEAWQLGYFKHPPLSAWVASAWFSVFPRTDAAYSVLSALNTAVGLAGFAVLCRQFMDARWTAVCVAAAALTPGLTTMAMRFNANAILVSTWPWAMAFFVRAMRGGRPGDAVAAGVVCGLAMLGKYFSGVLLVSLALAALCEPAWRARLLSRTGAIVGLSCLLVSMPHLGWLVSHGWAPIAYAREATGFVNGSPAGRALRFFLCMLVFPALGFALIAGASRRMRDAGRALLSVLRPSADPIWVLAMAPVLLTVAATVVTGARTATVWALPMGMGLVMWLGVQLRRTAPNPDLRVLGGGLALAWTLAVVGSALLWRHDAAQGEQRVAEPRAELAALVDARWRVEQGGPLRWVTGTRPLAASVAFYAPARPAYWSVWASGVETPWVDRERVAADGGAVVCAADDAACAALGESMGGRRIEVSVGKSVRDHVFAAVDFVVVLVPPSQRWAP